MPLSTYDELQTSILSWLARPGDPLVSPAVPDMIQLFEREATRRLKVGGAEKRASLTALSAAVALPADFGELRLATSGGVILTYVTPMQLPDGGGPPVHYTIIGNELRLGPSPSGGCTIEIVYQSGVPPLSDTNVSNWLLAQHPDCYLFGSLVEAESFIGSDDRIPLWAQRREAAFSSIETADRKARWGGAPLSIRAEGVSGGNGTAAGDWTSAPPVPIPITGIVAGDGLFGGGTEGLVTVSLSTPVTIGRGGTGASTAADALANLGAVAKAGDAMTGPLAVTTALKVDGSFVQQLLGTHLGQPRWDILLGDTAAETGSSNAGSDFEIRRYSDAGAYLGTPLTINRATGALSLSPPLSVANGGTGATAAGAALANLGGAPLASPTLSGNPTAPTPAPGDADTSIATTAFVGAALSAQALAGDVTGPASAVAVVRLQGRPVASTAPGSAQVLQWSGTNWAPATIGGVGTITGVTAGAGLAGGGTTGTVTLSLSSPVAVANGGTGGATAAAARTALGAVNIAGDTMTGALGVGSAPVTRLHVAEAGSALPATSGSAQSAGHLARFDDLSGAVLDFGGNAAGGMWLQATGFNDHTLNYPLLLNPNGSTVQIGSAVMYRAGTSDPLTIQSDASLWCRAVHVGNRRWTSGVVATGEWALSDETAGALRIAVSTAGACTNTTGTWAAISDASLKDATSIQPYERGLAEIMQLEPVAFRYTGKGGLPDGPQFGLIADMVEAVIPEVCGEVDLATGPDSPSLLAKTVDPGRLIYSLINAVKELSAKVSALEGGAPAAQRRRQ